MRRMLANRLRALAHRLHPMPGPSLPAQAFRGQVPHVPRVQQVNYLCGDVAKMAEMERHLARRYGHGPAGA